MTGLEGLVLVAVLIGVVGVVVPLLPGAVLVAGAVLVWAIAEGSVTGWVTCLGAGVLIVAGQELKYTVPGKHLKASGVPNRSLMAGGLLGIVGFFVIPIVGLFVGFVLGVYLAELHRVGGRAAWPSTKVALRATGVSMLIELAFTLLGAGVWIGAVVVT